MQFAREFDGLSVTMGAVETLHLTKHQSFGNDFLVAVLEDERHEELKRRHIDWPGVARILCDRRLGIGADGLVVGIANGEFASGDTVQMLLFNSDGSSAKTSGNGMACLGQALGRSKTEWREQIDEGADFSLNVVVAAEGGYYSVFTSSRIDDRVDGKTVFHYVCADVEMPPVGDGPGVSRALSELIDQDFPGGLSATGDVGNPHLVVATRRSVDEAETAHFGQAYERHFVGGINVEFIWPSDVNEGSNDGGSSIDMTVWERGAGITLACGSGAVVAATRAAEWGLVEPDGVIGVRMPGGATTVVTQPFTPTPMLSVYPVHIADVQWTLGERFLGL